MFEKSETLILGCFVLKPKVLSDHRGKFVKILHNKLFGDLGLESDFKEEYYSTSSKGVLRGLHFQEPPHEHVKCVTCLQGELFDAVVDLRKNSPTFGKNFTITLSADNPAILYIPAGLAHGFMAMEDNTLFLNKTTTVFNGGADSGVRWDSCGIKWPGISPILSEKDQNMTPFEQYDSPF